MSTSLRCLVLPVLLAAAALTGCEKTCTTEGFDEIWADLVDDFGDAGVMGGKPMGCQAGYPGGYCPEGAVCQHQLMSFYHAVSIAEAEERATAMLKRHGYEADLATRKVSADGPVSLLMRKGDAMMELAIGRVGENAEVILIRPNLARK